jgi:hypothetical protein
MEPWTKPYFITEYAFPGMDAFPKTDWGTTWEPTSTQKAEMMREHYQKGILDHPGRVLGGYAFYWGPSGSSTSAWHSLLLKTSEKLGATDVLQELWSGTTPENRAPVIEPFAGTGLVRFSSPGTRYSLWVEASDPDGDTLTGTYEILRDDAEERFVGDFEQSSPVVARSEFDPTRQVSWIIPDEPGGYRLVAIVKDGNGKAAVATYFFGVE